MRKAVRPITILLAVAAFFAGAASAKAAPAALTQPTNTCWRDVVNDWLNHQPNVAGTYPIPCYTQALQHLNQYTDIAGYSSAPDDIRRALLAAIRDQRGGGDGGPSSGGGGPSSSSGGGGPSSSNGGGGSGGGGSNPSSSGNGGLGGVVGVHDATSIPLPLIVLGALAVLLALAALATWLARRFQERRVQPAPAVHRRR